MKFRDFVFSAVYGKFFLKFWIYTVLLI